MYFLSIYKRKSKVKGYTVVSSSEFSKNDAIKAFEKLVLFTVFANNYFSIGEQRAKISEDYFYAPAYSIQDYLQINNGNPILEKGREILLKFGDLQKEFKVLIKQFSNHYDDHILKTNKIDDDDFERITEVLAHINRIQYLQGKTLLENYSALKMMEKEMQNTKIMLSIPKDNMIFLKELLNGIKKTEDSIKDLEDQQKISHLPTEEQIEISKKSIYQAALAKLPRYKQDLRYPKP
ncbi:hypothetical protein JOC86_004860 [Bacillus pakistanensis]|uniref:Uncharacterized protein n=1 Tax=Rossellomorea pakistanensis TaxID=992288 RepID=A0ABS2NKE3_9BACI|nr:hypothetical protein [Bacillus pakistanensis]MBM7588263.1 hypothetical protein [Bacillus pakistanensis]